MQHKILLVEDDISIANILAEHIEKYGYKCVIAEDFNNILNIFIEEKPHVVLLDANFIIELENYILKNHMCSPYS